MDVNIVPDTLTDTLKILCFPPWRISWSKDCIQENVFHGDKISSQYLSFSSFLIFNRNRDRIDPFAFKFQFKNVEYSSGRNKTYLCYLVDKGSADGLARGYLEDEHAGLHAEEAFFLQILPDYDPALKYNVTWYEAMLALHMLCPPPGNYAGPSNVMSTTW